MSAPGYGSIQTRYTLPTIDTHIKTPRKPLLKLHIGGKQAKAGWKILNAQALEGVDYIGDVRDLVHLKMDAAKRSTPRTSWSTSHKKTSCAP